MTFLAVGCAALLLAPRAAFATPIFTASYSSSDLFAGVGWSSDLGPNVGDSTGPFSGDGTPVTAAASAIRDGRMIAAQITQTAPYVLDDQYWAASWTGTFDIPGPGLYGLFAGAQARGEWSFDIPGLTFAELINTTFYFAAVWDMAAPSDLHPAIDAPGAHLLVPPFHASSTGSFELAPRFFQTGNPWFSTNVFVAASTFAQDSNRPGTVDFSYRIALSTTPIDASVFDPAPSAVPEPSTCALLAGPIAGLIARRWRRGGTASHTQQQQEA
jgi:hypothetical protein